MLELTIEDLLNEKNLKEFQREFLLFHPKFKYEEHVLDLSLEDLQSELGSKKCEFIQYDFEGNEKLLKFEEDYLIPKLRGISNIRINQFVESIRSNSIYCDGAINNFTKKELNELDRTKKMITIENHLGIKTKDVVTDEVNKIYDYISEYYQNNFQIDNKINLYLRKSEIITLFHLLIHNELIPIPKKKKELTNIFRKIERSFRFYDLDTGSFEDIKEARKLYNEMFGKTARRPYDNQIKQLKKFFLDEDFFDIDEPIKTS